jgi:Family of unknown function (DUF5677)
VGSRRWRSLARPGFSKFAAYPSDVSDPTGFGYAASYPEQMQACLDLFALTERLKEALPLDREADRLILQIAARTTKTYRAVLHLCIKGHGEQATMLNRSMFEDVIVAYWVHLHPDEAVEHLKDHRTHTLQLWRDHMSTRGLELGALEDLPDLSDEERNRLDGLFGARGNRGWTGLRNYEMLKSIEGTWGDAEEVRLLGHMHDVHLRHANATLHVSALSLLQPRPSEGNPSLDFYDSAPSERDVPIALLGAFWAYAHMSRLIHPSPAREEIVSFYRERLPLFFARPGGDNS